MSAGPEFARVAVALTSWPPTDGVLAWTVESPAEGVEVLATRGLWPWPVDDDAAPRWWCERCQGTDDLMGECDRFPCFSKSHPCLECDGGSAADPPTLAALVAVASLGAPTLLRVEELARVLVGREPRVVFRIVARETARERHERTIGREPRATPAERDLAAIGLHVVGLDGDRVTLAVEAL